MAPVSLHFHPSYKKMIEIRTVFLHFSIFTDTLSNQLHHQIVKSFSSSHDEINPTQSGETKFTYTCEMKRESSSNTVLSLSLIFRLQNNVLDHSIVMKG